MSIASEITRLQTAKANLKTAINNKGGSLTTETIDQYPTAVTALQTGIDVSDANAVVGDVLTGKTFYAVDDTKKTGTMADNGTVNTDITTKAQEVTIQQGYHSGSGKVKISTTEQAKIVADNIKSGVTILGQAGAVTPAKEEETKTVTPNFASGNVVVTPTSGKALSQVTFSKDTTNHIAGNIKKDITLYGVTGTLESGGTGEITGYTATFTLEYPSETPYVKFIYLNGTTETIYADGVYNNVVYIHVITDRSYDIIIPDGATYAEFMNGFWLKNDVYCYSAACLTGDTLITMSDNTTKRIDEMEVGDCFLRYNFETQSLEEDTVSYTDSKMNKTASEYDVWTFDDGTIIKTVHRHEFYNVELESMEYMDKWEIGQHTYKIDGTTPKLIKHETIKETVKHYSLKGKKTYTTCFANNLLTGNRHCRGKKIILEAKNYEYF